VVQESGASRGCRCNQLVLDAVDRALDGTSTDFSSSYDGTGLLGSRISRRGMTHAICWVQAENSPLNVSKLSDTAVLEL